MRGTVAIQAVIRGRSLRDQRLQDGDAETGKAKLPTGGLKVKEGRRYRCGNVADVVLVYFLQLAKRPNLSRPQRLFLGQALSHLGIVHRISQVQAPVPSPCRCSDIHSAINCYREDWRLFQLSKSDRILTFRPERQSKESLRVVSRVIAYRLGEASRPKRKRGKVAK